MNSFIAAFSRAAFRKPTKRNAFCEIAIRDAIQLSVTITFPVSNSNNHNNICKPADKHLNLTIQYSST
ncbi:hypothetical protein T4D_970 [Trichinella pseudospiralis]|uniref:Uncharacterized protein n=1 Tax=Trichinella pseudospiralis TaxID=6337 RepID=A0A0V1FDQ5_TRIPS|nr:hypothetical protein T4D_970 [Trichinella pseudospiralis]